MSHVLDLRQAIGDLESEIKDLEKLIKSHSPPNSTGEFDSVELDLMKQQCKKMIELRHIMVQRLRHNESDVY